MGFQTGSEMGMKFEVIGSWNGNNHLRLRFVVLMTDTWRDKRCIIIT